MVVEDNELNRISLVRLLRYTGALVDSASSVEVALHKLQSGPKIILLDINLPDGSGEEVLHHIRSHDLPVAVCVVTGSADPASLERIKLLKPEAIFIKPIIPDKLFHWIEEVVTAVASPSDPHR